MTPGLLVLIVAAIWIAALVGLLRVLDAMERVEREAEGLTAWPQGGRGPEHG